MECLNSILIRMVSISMRRGRRYLEILTISTGPHQLVEHSSHLICRSHFLLWTFLPVGGWGRVCWFTVNNTIYLREERRDVSGSVSLHPATWRHYPLERAGSTNRIGRTARAELPLADWSSLVWRETQINKLEASKDNLRSGAERRSCETVRKIK